MPQEVEMEKRVALSSRRPYIPSGQGVAVKEEEGQKVPMGHRKGAAEFWGQEKPAGQGIGEWVAPGQ